MAVILYLAIQYPAHSTERDNVTPINLSSIGIENSLSVETDEPNQGTAPNVQLCP